MIPDAAARRARAGDPAFYVEIAALPNRHLPTRICATCRRPFAWRKKWARDWDRVKYCSARCSRRKPR